MKPEPDILPPHSESDEFGILGCVLQEPARWLPECGKISDASFYDHRCKLVWRAIESIQSQSQSIDLVTIGQWLKKTRRLKTQ